VFPGLGHLIAGDRAKALRWAAAMIAYIALASLPFAFPALVPALLLLLPGQLLLAIIACIDAYRTAKRTQCLMLGRPALRYLAAIGLMVVAAAGRPAFPLAYYLRANWMEAFWLPTASMSPTIRPGDRFLAHKRVGFGRWSIVVFDSIEYPGTNFVFRVVGLPGEVVEIRQATLHINGKPMQTPAGIGPYSDKNANGQPLIRSDGRPGNGCEGRPITLGADEYFVLGDNSPIAGDSRYWSRPAPGHQPGVVPRSNIIGRATWIYWPPSHWKSLDP